MDALGTGTRLRLSAFAEWAVAAAFLFASIAVASLIVGELRTAPRFGAEAAAAPASISVPAGVPERAVSVPVLALPDGTALKLGESVSAVSSKLGRSAESGRQEVDRGRFGDRLTRFYEHAGSRFILVFEPTDPGGEARLSAIFVR
jgi:hypothetical protein